MTATRLEQIRLNLVKDLERGLYAVGYVLERVAKHTPEDTHIGFDVQDHRITVEGELTCEENLATLRSLAKEFGTIPNLFWIADGWDGHFTTPAPEFVCVWVTNVGDPESPKPKL